MCAANCWTPKHLLKDFCMMRATIHCSLDFRKEATSLLFLCILGLCKYSKVDGMSIVGNGPPAGLPTFAFRLFDGMPNVLSLILFLGACIVGPKAYNLPMLVLSWKAPCCLLSGFLAPKPKSM